MEKNNLLNKPIVLSLLLFLFSFIVEFVLGYNASLFILCLKYIIIIFLAALLLGLFQKKLKISLDKIKKIKIAVYYSMIYIILFIPISTFLSYISLKHHIVAFITALMFMGIYLAFGLFLYLGLIFGCKISNSIKAGDIDAEKLITDTVELKDVQSVLERHIG